MTVTWRSPRAAVAALTFAGYLVIARSAGNLYPFSTYSMYAESGSGRPSRIVARDARGELKDLGQYDHWSCPDLPALDHATCPPPVVSTTILYIDRDAEHYVRTHMGTGLEPGSQPLELVRHVWSFTDRNGPPREIDCPVCACRAVPR